MRSSRRSLHSQPNRIIIALKVNWHSSLDSFLLTSPERVRLLGLVRSLDSVSEVPEPEGTILSKLRQATFNTASFCGGIHDLIPILHQVSVVDPDIYMAAVLADLGKVIVHIDLIDRVVVQSCFGAMLEIMIRQIQIFHRRHRKDPCKGAVSDVSRKPNDGILNTTEPDAVALLGVNIVVTIYAKRLL